jgi:calcineurin-like phosphoesterase family protein
LPRMWFHSDPHYGHAKLMDKGARPFTAVKEMNLALIENHNALVNPSDISVCLGDFALDPKLVPIFAPLLHGHRWLILGNHDIEDTSFYLQYFERVMMGHEWAGLWFSHIPIAPWSMRWKANVHGHVHLAQPLFYSKADPTVDGFSKGQRYINISVERTNYRPVTLEQIVKWST